MSIGDAAKWANVIMLTMPDTEQKATYEEFIKPHMKQGQGDRLRPRLQHPLQAHPARRRPST